MKQLILEVIENQKNNKKSMYKIQFLILRNIFKTKMFPFKMQF